MSVARALRISVPLRDRDPQCSERQASTGTGAGSCGSRVPASCASVRGGLFHGRNAAGTNANSEQRDGPAERVAERVGDERRELRARAGATCCAAAAPRPRPRAGQAVGELVGEHDRQHRGADRAADLLDDVQRRGRARDLRRGAASASRPTSSASSSSPCPRPITNSARAEQPVATCRRSSWVQASDAERDAATSPAQHDPPGAGAVGEPAGDRHRDHRAEALRARAAGRRRSADSPRTTWK